MSKPPRTRTIKRSLLAAVCVLAIAAAATQPGRTRTAKYIGAVGRTLPATVIAQPSRSAPMKITTSRSSIHPHWASVAIVAWGNQRD